MFTDKGNETEIDFTECVEAKKIFVDTDVEQLSDGMRYTPMKYER